MAYYYLDGVFKFKKDIATAQVTKLNDWAGFHCSTIRFQAFISVVENGKRRLYYGNDSVVDSTAYLVWEEGKGWIKDCYRTVTFDYQEIYSSTLYNAIVYNSEEFMQTNINAGANTYHTEGVKKVHRGAWVFSETIDYCMGAVDIDEIHDTVRFSSMGKTYTSMTWKYMYGEFMLIYSDGTTDYEAYSSVTGWKYPGARIVDFTGDAYGNDYIEDDLQLCAFIIAMASENAILEYNGSYIVTFTSDNQVTIPCRETIMESDLVLYVGPHVGACKVYFGGELKVNYDVTGNISNSTKGRKITVPCNGLIPLGDIVIKIQ